MGGAAVGGRCAREHGRPYERVTEGGAPGREADEPGRLGRLEPGQRPAEVPRRAEHRLELVAVGNRGGEQRRQRRGGQLVEPPPQRALDPRADRHVIADRPGPQPRRLARELDQRERVAAGGRVQPPGRVRGDRPRGVCLEQRARRLGGQAGQDQLVEPGTVDRGRLARAHGQQHDDRVGEQAPRGEHQRRRRGPVDPLHVVREHDDGPLLREGRQQAERRRADEMRLRGGGGREAERGLERRALRAGQALELAQHRAQQLVQPGEGDLDLRLDAAHAQHRDRARRVGGVLEQRRLADPRVAAQDQDPARALAGPRHQRVDAPALGRAPEQHGAILTAHVRPPVQPAGRVSVPMMRGCPSIVGVSWTVRLEKPASVAIAPSPPAPKPQ